MRANLADDIRADPASSESDEPPNDRRSLGVSSAARHRGSRAVAPLMAKLPPLRGCPAFSAAYARRCPGCATPARCGEWAGARALAHAVHKYPKRFSLRSARLLASALHLKRGAEATDDIRARASEAASLDHGAASSDSEWRTQVGWSASVCTGHVVAQPNQRSGCPAAQDGSPGTLGRHSWSSCGWLQEEPVGERLRARL